MNPPESINSTIEPIIAALRIVAGKRLQDNVFCIAPLTLPPQAPSTGTLQLYP